jgi:hypothetical protein
MGPPRRRTNARSRPVPGSFALAAAVLLAGCAAHESPTVATARQPAAASGSASVGPSPATKDTDYDKALRYTRCMNQHGVTMPDPVEGKALGMPTFTVGDTDAALQVQVAAYDTCRQFLPATWPIKADPVEVARDRAYDECMGRNGFPQPEPDANGMLHEPTDSKQELSPQYSAAVARCRHLLDDKANK